MPYMPHMPYMPYMLYSVHNGMMAADHWSKRLTRVKPGPPMDSRRTSERTKATKRLDLGGAQLSTDIDTMP